MSTNNAKTYICPICGIMLTVGEELIHEKSIKCLTCGGIFGNPYYIGQSNSQKNWLIAIVVIIVLIIIGSHFDNENSSTTQSKVQNSELDASVWQVKKYLNKEYLKDPKSYESIEWSSVNKMDNGSYYVRHKYRAKNSFGGYVVENKIFYLDVNGNVVNVKDY